VSYYYSTAFCLLLTPPKSELHNQKRETEVNFVTEWANMENEPSIYP
jgi:hypothetical protein